MTKPRPEAAELEGRSLLRRSRRRPDDDVTPVVETLLLTSRKRDTPPVATKREPCRACNARGSILIVDARGRRRTPCPFCRRVRQPWP